MVVMALHQVVRLSQYDMDVLRSPCYLTDDIIGFYFGYLSSYFKSADILLVPPSVCLLMASCEDDTSLKQVVAPLEFQSKAIILFPLIGIDENCESGTHWSLLVYHRARNAFIHHDSMAGVNSSHASALYQSLKALVGPADPLPSTASSSKAKSKKKRAPPAKATAQINVIESSAVAEPSFEEGPTVQQSNGYDCGLYVLAIARSICKWYVHERSPKSNNWFGVLARDIDVSIESTMRDHILKHVTQQV